MQGATRKVTYRSKKYGWKRDLPDHRDRMLKVPLSASLPKSVDLRSGCPPVYDQGNLGCHDEKTEVLTEGGWLPWKDYDGRLLLGTMHPVSHELQFQAPTALHSYSYRGPMHVLSHRSLDYSLTPNHRMYVRPWDERRRTLSGDFAFREVQDLGWYSGLPASTSGWAGTYLDQVVIGRREIKGDDLMALCALICSDGWVGGTENNWNRLSFCCFREDRLPFVRDFADRFGFREVPGRRGVWLLADEVLAHWFRSNAFIGDRYRSPFKRVPEIVKQAHLEQIRIFLNFFGDQHIDQERGRQFYSASRRMIDDLQELLLRCGKRSSIYERAPRSTQMKDGRRIEADHCTADLTLIEHKSDQLSISRKGHCGTVDYNGQVFCATVPNGLLVTRRNGSVLVSGNSCTANAIAAAVDFERAKQKLPLMTPSRLFIYYNERAIEGSVDEDSGAMIRDGIKTIASQGVCAETLWPYDIEKFRQKPTGNCYDDAVHHKTLRYLRVSQTPFHTRHSLASGYPFVFGFTVYEGFESAEVAKTGIAQMPKPDEAALGGHAVVCVGYDDTQSRFLCRNSWGAGFGMAGYFSLPSAYLLNPGLAGDFWTIRLEQ